MSTPPTKTDVPDKLTGFIPRVERQEQHYEFLWRVRPPTVMVNLRHARRIIAYDGSFFPPECNVILTTTIADEELKNYTFKDELKIVRKLKPDYVIPFDFPVYGDMDSNTREEHLKQIAHGCKDMDIILGNLNDDTITNICEQKELPRELVAPSQETTVLPLVKGFSSHERRILYDTAREIQSPCLVKYGVQYMTVGENGHFVTLRDDLKTIQQESSNYPVIVIGLSSPTGKYSLEQLPDNVVAGIGTNQWKKQLSTPNKTDPFTLQCEFKELYNTAARVLNTRSKYQVLVGRENKEVFTPETKLSKNPGKGVTDDLELGTVGAAGDKDYGFGQRKRPDDAMNAIKSGRIGGQKSPQED